MKTIYDKKPVVVADSITFNHSECETRDVANTRFDHEKFFNAFSVAIFSHAYMETPPDIIGPK
jgi:hypothetical protein